MNRVLRSLGQKIVMGSAPAKGSGKQIQGILFGVGIMTVIPQ
jgi:hypothetical protein